MNYLLRSFAKLEMNSWVCLCWILQGDVLITKCTYNTEDRNKSTVVSTTQSRYMFILKFILSATAETRVSPPLISLHIFSYILLILSCTYVHATRLLREVLASWRKCVLTTFTTTLELSWSSARPTSTRDTCRNTSASLTGSTRTDRLPLPQIIRLSPLVLHSLFFIWDLPLHLLWLSNFWFRHPSPPHPPLAGTRLITSFNLESQMLCPLKWNCVLQMAIRTALFLFFFQSTSSFLNRTLPPSFIDLPPTSLSLSLSLSLSVLPPGSTETTSVCVVMLVWRSSTLRYHGTHLLERCWTPFTIQPLCPCTATSQLHASFL